MTDAHAGASAVMSRLSVMMFLQFFVWGSWYVTVGNYMTKIGLQDWIGDAYTVGPIAAVVSPFFLGMIADRFFATERVLAAMHLLGAAAMAGAAQVSQQENPDPRLFVGLLLAHMLCYMPTLGLTNTLAFHNLTNRDKQFPLVRVFGTIGWIAANIVVSKGLQADNAVDGLYAAAIASAALGLFSLTLPHTPPPAAGTKATVRDVLGLRSLALMKDPNFAVFTIASMLICIPLAAYYAFAPVFVGQIGSTNPGFDMTFGQVSEIFFMLIMPLFFVRLGVKWMLLIGMLAWVARYALFALAVDDRVAWMIMGGIVLHGICYDFFFVTGFIYVDRRAPKEIRGQAQGFLVLVTQGLGLGLGAQIVSRVLGTQKIDEADAGFVTLKTQVRSAVEFAPQLAGEKLDKAWEKLQSLPQALFPPEQPFAETLVKGMPEPTVQEGLAALTKAHPLDGRIVSTLVDHLQAAPDSAPAELAARVGAMGPGEWMQVWSGSGLYDSAAVKADIAGQVREIAGALRTAAEQQAGPLHDAMLAKGQVLWDTGTDLYMDTTRWTDMWAIAAGAAAVVAVFFAAFFWDRPPAQEPGGPTSAP